MEYAVARMKDRLLVANHDNPMIRSGALFDMRLGFATLIDAVEWARPMIEQQRLHAEEAARTKETRRKLRAYYDDCAAEPDA